MRVAGIEFRPTLVPTVTAVFFLSVMIAAGNWQLRRADGARARAAYLDTLSKLPPVAVPKTLAPAADYEMRRVTATGHFDVTHQILIDNQTHDNAVGFKVVTPLVVDGSQVRVLVDRGFVPDMDRKHLPVISTPKGVVTVEGIAVVPPKKYFELSSQQVSGSVWQNLEMARYRKQAPWPVQPFVINQLNDTPDHLVRYFQRPDSKVNMHLGYALQWYAMAATVVVLYVVLNAKRNRKKAD